MPDSAPVEVKIVRMTIFGTLLGLIPIILCVAIDFCCPNRVASEVGIGQVLTSAIIPFWLCLYYAAGNTLFMPTNERKLFETFDVAVEQFRTLNFIGGLDRKKRLREALIKDTPRHISHAKRWSVEDAVYSMIAATAHKEGWSDLSQEAMNHLNGLPDQDHETPQNDQDESRERKAR